jgi:ABC-type Fe3+-hydroxamate transport system substrate-binding protein
MTKTIKQKKLNPGRVVLSELGMTAAANACGVKPSTVWRWAQDSETGTGGTIPARHHMPLLNLARDSGKVLTADDLVYGRSR